jgi:predicted phage baseplate assembly protein
VNGTTCGCCSGVSVGTPQPVENRPGLPEIAYRVGRHGDFLRSMIARLTDADRPGLAALTTRDGDDVTIALLDGCATVADVLAFYNERLANESYLRTAHDRVSLRALGQLIGYQLDRGAAAETHVAFAIEPAPQIPAAQSKDPGVAPQVTPSQVTLDEGLRIQSIPGPGERPQTFETVETIDARPGWNAMAVATTVDWVPELGQTERAWLEGVGLNLAVGDVFLLVGSDVLAEQWDVRILEEVTPDPEANRTEVRWTPALGSLSPVAYPASAPEAYVLRKRLNVFGHNAPMWKSMSDDFRGDYASAFPGWTENASNWPNFEITAASDNAVDLDGSHPDVVAGSWVVLSRPNYRELWKVDEVAELSRAEFAISGKVTRLTLTGGENYDIFDDRVRDTTVYAVSEELTLVDEPDESPVTGDWVLVEADVSAMQEGRKLIVTGTTMAGATATELVEVKSVIASGSRWKITFESGLTEEYERSTVVVHGNVALATHGETVTEILGSGRAATPFQRFALARPDLTFVQSSEGTGTSTTLAVRVNGVAWTEVPTLYESRPSDQEFSVRVDERDRTVVRFGDGMRGARLPTGSQNVVAEYRHGGGAAGNVPADSLAQLLDRPLGVKGVSNPLAAQGGVDAETEETARSSIPLTTRTLGRAVSLLDYADYARAFTGVSKAHAIVLPLRGVRTIVVTVAFTPGTVSDPTTRAGDLELSLQKFGDPHVEVKVVPHDERTFRLGLRVGVGDGHDEATVLAAVRTRLTSAFAFERRELGQPIHRSEIVAEAHTVAGVMAVDVDHFYAGTTPDLADRLLPQLPAVTSTGGALPAGLLVIASDPFDSLDVMS